MWSRFTAWVLLSAAATLSSQNVYHIAPTDNSSVSCASPPCLTIAQYTRDTTKYFTDGATFVFLPGNHSIETTVNLTNTCNITLKGDRNGTSYVVCMEQFNFLFENAGNLKITGLTFVLTNNQHEDSFALIVSSSAGVLITNSTFLGSGDIDRTPAWAICSMNSNITLVNSLFQGNTGREGGAVVITRESTLTLLGNVFTKNSALSSGGAISAHKSLLILNRTNEFSFNSGESLGGAIYCYNCSINMIGESSFKNNYLRHPVHYTGGGAMSIDSGILNISGTVYFLHNKGGAAGGALYLTHSEASLMGHLITFEGNSADYGGAMKIKSAAVMMNTNMNFSGNIGKISGGAIDIGPTEPSENPEQVVVSGIFVNNRASCGGAIAVNKERKVLFKNIELTGNSKSGICISESEVRFEGNTRILFNTGELGGGIQSKKKSFLSFWGHTRIENNSATIGGGIAADDSVVAFNSITVGAHNSAHSDGGVIYARNSDIAVRNTTTFQFNCARNGGVMYLTGLQTMLYLELTASITTSYNTAEQYGGVIYYKDDAISIQCLATENIGYNKFPSCFLQVPEYIFHPHLRTLFYSSHDSAGIDGSFLYGGLLDKCKIDWKIELFQSNTEPYHYYIESGVVNISNSTGEDISSEPYKLCFCTSSGPTNGCTTTKSIETHRGQTFSVSVIAIGQGGAATQAQITAATIGNSRLKLLQSTQNLFARSCSKLNYTVYSTEAHETLSLYLHGPCEDIRSASAVINVTLLPCPAAFRQLGEECVCEKRLYHYDVNCTLGDQIYITRKAGATFWMSTLYSNNGSYQGLILCSTCPSQYCQSERIDIILDHLDIQCAPNRSGVLCGACATNYSLLLGGSRCGVCTNTHLALLLPLACAGVSLVAFLTFLKMTVATGMLNSLILYANIVQVNRNTLFPTSDSVNVLTVFIAWLNLDLGFETCFYDGMDAFAQTFLQFAFPVYVWIIIGLIIFSSQYSTLVSKLIGSNPIAVLATLLLMSYTKILKIAIDLYSSVTLDYPNNLTITVWLKDANEPYLQSRHIFLTVMTSLVLVFLFLPYTLFLLFGSRLYRFIGRKHFHWLGRLKPLLDAYYAPFNRHTRYWIGILLLVRCALYAVFSYNSLGGTSKSLLAIIITFTAMVAKVWFSGRVYRKLHVNIIEVSMHLNLIVLSAATLAQVNTPGVVHFLVGVVFATTLGIIVYHFHLLYIARTAVWLKVEARLSSCHLLRREVGTTTPAQDEPQHATSRDPHQIISKTVVELREPLLEK